MNYKRARCPGRWHYRVKASWQSCATCLADVVLKQQAGPVVSAPGTIHDHEMQLKWAQCHRQPRMDIYV